MRRLRHYYLASVARAGLAAVLGVSGVLRAHFSATARSPRRAPPGRSRRRAAESSIRAQLLGEPKSQRVQRGWARPLPLSNSDLDVPLAGALAKIVAIGVEIIARSELGHLDQR